MMLTLMKSSGSFLSNKRRHINKINYFAEKINKYYQSQPEKALEYVNKLITYHQKLQGEKNLSKEVRQWFVDSQTLATTLYQLGSGRLPKQKMSEMSNWENAYNFKQPIFSGEHGHFFKELIIRLNLQIPTTMDHVLAQIDEYLFSEEVELNDLLPSEDAELIELPLPRKSGNYTKL